MDAALLARIQFAFTAGFHFIFPPITIGMAWVIVWMMTRWKNTGSDFWYTTAHFWIKIFTATFAVGVATGLTLEFQFGTNWADYSRFVGDIFGAPLAAEGIFAFFLESTFLGVLVFGWKRFSPRLLWFSMLMVAVGSTLSSLWILIANSWMQTPDGYTILDGRAVLTDFWAAAANPSTAPRFFHTVDAALITGAFMVMGISAMYLLKNKHMRFAAQSMKMALFIAFFATLAQVAFGHWHAVQVVNSQPEKLAAMEGHFETTNRAPLKLFGIPDVENERFYFAIEMPPFLSILAHGDSNRVVTGLKEFPKEDRPPVILPFFGFHFMVLIGFAFVAFVVWGLYLQYENLLDKNKWFLKLAVLMIPLPHVANLLGWIVAEVGRQPWAVYHVIRTRDAISPNVDAGAVLVSLIAFVVAYGILFTLWIYMLKKLIAKGPDPYDATQA